MKKVFTAYIGVNTKTDKHMMCEFDEESILSDTIHIEDATIFEDKDFLEEIIEGTDYKAQKIKIEFVD